jgi:RNA polymerase sigma factor (sigma-70 family)
MYPSLRQDDDPAPLMEADHFRRAQAGCPDSLNHLMAKHDRLVYAVMRRQALGSLPIADALHAGRIALWRAILGYDPRRGLAFSTYAWPSIARGIWDAVKAADRPPPLVLPPHSVTCGESDPITAGELAAIQAAVHDLVARLPDHLRTIIVAHYGLGDEPPASFACIGARLGLSKQRIHQLHRAALIWLRQPAHSQQLRSLLERHTLADYDQADAQAQAERRQWRGRHDRSP